MNPDKDTLEGTPEGGRPTSHERIGEDDRGVAPFADMTADETGTASRVGGGASGGVRRRAACLGIVFGLAAAPGAIAQEVTYSDDPASPEAFELLEDRMRDHRDLGEALTVVGVRQGDNDFLSGTHALQRGTFAPVQMDRQDAHARKLAMLEGSFRFDQAPRRARDETATYGHAAAPAAASAPPAVPEETEEEPFDTGWIGMALAAVATAAIFVFRDRFDA